MADEPQQVLEQPADCACLHDAVVKQDRRAVAWYLQRQPNSVMARDEDGRTPLLLAAAAGDTATCTLLIRRMSTYNADAINWADAGGLTPLHWALTQQRHEAAALLLRHAASTSVADEDGRRPLHAAAFSGNERCISLLLPHVSKDGVSAASDDRLTPLHYAAVREPIYIASKRPPSPAPSRRALAMSLALPVPHGTRTPHPPARPPLATAACRLRFGGEPAPRRRC